MESSDRAAGAISELRLPFIEVFDNSSCLKLFYSLVGKEIGEFIVMRYDADGHSSTLWSKRGEILTDWSMLFLRLQPGLFQLSFKGVVKGGPFGDIAIDDISINKCDIMGEYPHPFKCLMYTDNVASNNLLWHSIHKAL